MRIAKPLSVNSRVSTKSNYNYYEEVSLVLGTMPLRPMVPCDPEQLLSSKRVLHTYLMSLSG
jgi:hypothetical protein